MIKNLIYAMSTGFTGSSFFEEIMDDSGRTIGKRLEKEGKLNYDMLGVHERINMKALITMDPTYICALSYRMDRNEFHLLNAMQMCTGRWRMTINIMLDKWQNIIEEREKKNEKSTE